MQANQSRDAQAPLLIVGSCVVITANQPAIFDTFNAAGALEVCLDGRIGSIVAFNDVHQTVRIKVDYEVDRDDWTHAN